MSWTMREYIASVQIIFHQMSFQMISRIHLFFHIFTAYYFVFLVYRSLCSNIRVIIILSKTASVLFSNICYFISFFYFRFHFYRGLPNKIPSSFKITLNSIYEWNEKYKTQNYCSKSEIYIWKGKMSKGKIYSIFGFGIVPPLLSNHISPITIIMIIINWRNAVLWCFECELYVIKT